jgi:hypothetical protein
MSTTKKRHIIHNNEHSLNVDGSVKLPSVDKLVYGEIGINYKQGYETLAIKNDKDKIVTFISAEQIKNELDEIKDKIEIPEEVYIGDKLEGEPDLFVDTSTDDSIDIYSKEQVDTLISDLQKEIEKVTIPDAGVSSVNGKTGAVELDIPELPENIVNTINGKTGDVEIEIPNIDNLTTKDELIATELTFSEAINDLNQRINDLPIPELPENIVNTINGKSGNVTLDIPVLPEKIVNTINGQSGVVTLNIPQQLKAGDNVKIENNEINVQGFIYKDSQTSFGSITLNNTDRNQSEGHSALGNYSTVCGYNCRTTDGESSANSFCGGDKSTASHEDCFVYGEGLTTGNSHQTVLGKYNNTINWNEQNVPLVIGWGTENAKKTIMALQDGSYSSNSNSDGGLMLWGPLKAGASWLNNDFGEYFEWADGNINNEDRIGYMVQLSGEKIELAKSFKKCIGAISATCSFIGGSCSLEWHGRFLKDEWGRHLYDENNNLIVNPKYDDSKEYKPRSQRKEWDIVGLLGQVLVRQDGTLKVGGFAGCENGVATNADNGYHVLKIINNEIALILIK